MKFSKFLKSAKKGNFLTFYFRTLNYKAKTSFLNLKHRLTRCFKPLSVLICSGGRIRTYNHLLTLIPMFPLGVDYIFAIFAKANLGTSVSSLYGAPAILKDFAGFPRYCPAPLLHQKYFRPKIYKAYSLNFTNL